LTNTNGFVKFEYSYKIGNYCNLTYKYNVRRVKVKEKKKVRNLVNKVITTKLKGGE